MRLLIVDDSATNLRLLRAQLEAEGHSVAEARDGVEALERLQAEGFDGVVSDILMPRMDGYRLCLELRKLPALAALPFVLYTSTYNSPGDRALAATAGADAYLTKPAPVESILAALRAAGGPRAETPAGREAPPPELAQVVLREYSELLVRKLEDKSAELEHANTRLARLNHTLSMLGAINALVVRVTERAALFREACRIAVSSGDFALAWIASLDGGRLRLFDGHGEDAHAPDWLRRAIEADDGRLAEVAAQAHASQRGLVLDEAAARALLGEAPRRDLCCALVVPFSIGQDIGVFVFHAASVEVFDAEERRLLEELAGDLTYAVDHLAKAERIAFVSRHDVLTGLPNRHLFEERIDDAIAARSPGFAVVVRDIERFRHVNATHGRAAGDELLRLVAQRFAQANSTVARLASDVFAFRKDDDQVTSLTGAIAGNTDGFTSEPFVVGGQAVRIGCRAGVALYPGDGRDGETLLRNAEAALRRARETSAALVFYAPEHNARAAEALDTENRLRRAIDRREFVLHYQPKISLHDRRICGVEALIRWQDPDRGLVPPGRFIPVLEECGLIGIVGARAMRQALEDQARWRAAGLRTPRVAVNVSPLQLREPDFAEQVARTVADFPGAQLELEITESLVMDNVERNIQVLQHLRDAGVEVSIDDFGTGYSSLAYIARLPVNCLKVDRAFVIRMPESPEGMSIVSSIVALAHALRLKVVAEGVETEEQAQLLKLLACEQAQGFLFSRPVPADAIEALLRGDGPLPVPNA